MLGPDPRDVTTMCDADHSSRLRAQRMVFLKAPIRPPAYEGGPEDRASRCAGLPRSRAGAVSSKEPPPWRRIGAKRGAPRERLGQGT
jgi:hypothetical protein